MAVTVLVGPTGQKRTQTSTKHKSDGKEGRRVCKGGKKRRYARGPGKNKRGPPP